MTEDQICARFAGVVLDRIFSGEPVTKEWLDEFCGSDRGQIALVTAVAKANGVGDEPS